MKNPNSPAGRIKRNLSERWSAEDYPGAKPRFQLMLLMRDIAIFLLLPLLAIAGVKACESSGQTPKRPNPPQSAQDRNRMDGNHSQIIQFAAAIGSPASGGALAPRRSPGSLVRVRLLNVVETYGTAPVHAQVIDSSLGNSLKGGTLIGDASADSTFERISINFRFARDPNREGVALPITARALELDGTLGLIADKKEGFVARSAMGSAALGSQDLQKGGGSPTDLQGLLLKALTAGLFQEMGASTQVARNRAQVLKLAPQTEFFAELTDFFPSGAR